MRTSVVLILALLGAALTVEAGTLVRFEGNDNTRTPVFEPGTPWMLYWYTQSDNALPKTFELRLYDADSGEYLGTVIQQRIIANGEKLFEDPGRYQVDVVAGNLDWTLVVSEVSAEKAAQLIRESKGQPTIDDTAARYARQVAESSFESWRPVDEQTLLLFAADETQGFRVSFEIPCRGLTDASALTFVSSGMGPDGELYDSVMLDDGTHCAFAKVIPTVFD
jgi:hypothetical protein